MRFFTTARSDEFVNASYYPLLKIVSVVGAAYAIRIVGAILTGYLYNKRSFIRMDSKNILCLATLLYLITATGMCFIQEGNPSFLIVIRLVIGITDGIDLIGSYLWVYDARNSIESEKTLNNNWDQSLQDIASFEKDWKCHQRKEELNEEFHRLHDNFNTYGFMGNTGGVFLTSALRLLLTPQQLNESGFRIPFKISAIFSLVALILRFLLPRQDSNHNDYNDNDKAMSKQQAYSFKDYINGLKVYVKCQWRELLLIASIFLFWGAGNYSIIVFIIYIFQSLLVLLNSANSDPSSIISLFLWLHLNQQSKKLNDPDEDVKEEFGGDTKRFTAWRFNILDIITKHHKLIETQQKSIEYLVRNQRKKSGLDNTTKKKSGLGLKKKKSQATDPSNNQDMNDSSHGIDMNTNIDIERDIRHSGTTSNVQKIETNCTTLMDPSTMFKDLFYIPQILTKNIVMTMTYSDKLDTMNSIYTSHSPKPRTPKE